MDTTIYRSHRTATALLLTVVLTITLVSAADTIDDKRAAREAQLGHLVAKTDTILAYSNDAIIQHGRAVCATGKNLGQLQSKLDSVAQQLLEVDQKYNKDMESFSFRKQVALSPVYENKTLSKKKKDKKIKAILDQFNRELGRINKNRMTRLEQLEIKRERLQLSLNKGLHLNILYSPLNMNETSLPMDSNQVSASAVREINEAIVDFLTSCEGVESAFVSYYFKDAFHYGEDRAISSFLHNVDDSVLTQSQCRKSSCFSFKRSILARTSYRYGTLNLSLADFITQEQKVAHKAGSYRIPFAYQAGRQDGIVYKLEPYWKQYEQFDFTRRIFEGDFDKYADWTEFKMTFNALAREYSKTCKDHVSHWQTYDRTEDVYDRTEHNMDGSRTIHKTRQTKTIKIDGRFGSQWAAYGPQINAEILEKGVIEGFGLAMAYRAQVQFFLQQHACDSAMAKQLIDNFIRAADRRPSVQQAGIKYAGADTESDAPTKAGKLPPPFTPLASISEGQSVPFQAAGSVPGEARTPATIHDIAVQKSGLNKEDRTGVLQSPDEHNRQVEAGFTKKRKPQVVSAKIEKGKPVSAPKSKSVEHGSVPSASGKVIAPKLHANPYARKAGRSSPLVADTAEGQQKTNEQKAEIRRMRKEMTYSQGQEMKRYKKLLGVKVSAYNKEKRALIKSRAEKNVIETLDRSHQKEAQGIFSEWEARTEPLKKAEQFINSAWKAVHELSQPRKTEKERDDLRKTVVDEQQRAAALLREYRQLVER